MRPLRYSINVTLDGCCDHRVMLADEELHRHAVANLEAADALLFGRVTYDMMEAFWRPFARTGVGPDWMLPFARTIDAARKYVVSSTLDRVDWNAELVRGDLGKTVWQLKQEPGTSREIHSAVSSSAVHISIPRLSSHWTASARIAATTSRSLVSARRISMSAFSITISC